jgi:hypothetical protein
MSAWFLSVVLLATSIRVAAVSAVAFMIAYLLPFYAGYRIGTRKGYTGFQWFWRVALFGWLGVLLLALRAPKPWTRVRRRRPSTTCPQEPIPGGRAAARCTASGDGNRSRLGAPDPPRSPRVDKFFTNRRAVTSIRHAH